MSILLSDLKLYGSQVMPDDDTILAIGGAKDTDKRMEFFDVNGLIQGVSSATNDTTQQITVFGRDAAGVIVSETQTLTGQTPVAFITTWERLLKALKNAICRGDVSVEAQTANRSSTLASGTLFNAVLDAGASGVDDFYTPMVARVTAGTDIGQIRMAIKYLGATKQMTFDHPMYTQPLFAGSVLRIAPGVYFESSQGQPEVFQVRRPFYNAFADAPGGVSKTYYDKGFFMNRNATLTLTGSQIIKAADGTSGLIDFGMVSPNVLDDITNNGPANTRQVAPAGVTFDSVAKAVGNAQNLSAGSSQGFWLRLTLPAGQGGANTTVTMRLSGSTV